MLAQQIQQRAFQRRLDMHGGAQVEGLQAAPAGIAVGETAAHLAENIVPGAQTGADHQVAAVFQGLADFLAARHFAHAGIAGAVGQDHQIAGEIGAMRARQVQQHAVLSGHRNDFHIRDARRAGDLSDMVILR